MAFFCVGDQASVICAAGVPLTRSGQRPPARSPRSRPLVPTTRVCLRAPPRPPPAAGTCVSPMSVTRPRKCRNIRCNVRSLTPAISHRSLNRRAAPTHIRSRPAPCHSPVTPGILARSINRMDAAGVWPIAARKPRIRCAWPAYPRSANNPGADDIHRRRTRYALPGLKPLSAAAFGDKVCLVRNYDKGVAGILMWRWGYPG